MGNINIFKTKITDPEGCDNWVHVDGIDGYISLCGWCDVPYVTVEDPVTCPTCLAMIKYCKSIKKGDLR